MADTDLTRRALLAAAATCACAACCPLARADDDNGDDDDSGPQVKPVPAAKTDVGALAAYGRDGFTDKWAATKGFLIVRGGGKLYALSSQCSHKGNTVVIKQGQIFCPKHKSVFDATGTPTRGPATKSGPLTRFGISLDASKHLVVDTGQKFYETDWDQAGAFIAVK